MQTTKLTQRRSLTVALVAVAVLAVLFAVQAVAGKPTKTAPTADPYVSAIDAWTYMEDGVPMLLEVETFASGVDTNVAMEHTVVFYDDGEQVGEPTSHERAYRSAGGGTVMLESSVNPPQGATDVTVTVELYTGTKKLTLVDSETATGDLYAEPVIDQTFTAN